MEYNHIQLSNLIGQFEQPWYNIGYTPRARCLSDLFTECRRHEVNKSLRQPSLWCVTYLYYDSASLVFYLPKVTQVSDNNGRGLFSKENTPPTTISYCRPACYSVSPTFLIHQRKDT